MHTANHITGLAIAGLTLAALLSTSGCGKAGDDTAAIEAATAPAGGDRATPPPAQTIAFASEELLEELPSLRRLEQALAGAPVNPGLTRADLLDSTRAWLAENSPELSPREAELQAQLLAMFEEFLDAEDISLARAMGMSEIQLLSLWGMDADGDGRLTIDEAMAGMGLMMQMDPATHPYFSDRFDTDGDGVVSEAEAQAAREGMMEMSMPLIETMIERAQLVSWDTNGDGVLSDAEIAEGEATLSFQDFDGDGEITQMERIAAYQSLMMEMNNAMVLLEQPDQMALQAEIQGELEAISAEPFPDGMDFDLDGDGVLSEVETSLYADAMRETRERMQQRSMEIVQQSAARYMIAQYDIAVNRLDQSGDDLLSDEEWEAGYEELRVERDRRLFHYLFDADRDGRVGDAEVTRFMDAYERKSPFADADMNGRVDVDDLRFFLRQVGNQ